MYSHHQAKTSGHACNHGSLRLGKETLRPLGVTMGNASSITSVWSMSLNTIMNLTLAGSSLWCHHRCDREHKRALVKYVIHFLSEGDVCRNAWSMAILKEPWTDEAKTDRQEQSFLMGRCSQCMQTAPSRTECACSSPMHITHISCVSSGVR